MPMKLTALTTLMKDTSVKMHIPKIQRILGSLLTTISDIGVKIGILMMSEFL